MPRRDEREEFEARRETLDRGESVARKETAEQLQQRLSTPAWLFAAAQAKFRWAVGQELTEEEYRAAVEAAAREVIRNA